MLCECNILSQQFIFTIVHIKTCYMYWDVLMCVVLETFINFIIVNHVIVNSLEVILTHLVFYFTQSH